MMTSLMALAVWRVAVGPIGNSYRQVNCSVFQQQLQRRIASYSGAVDGYAGENNAADSGSSDTGGDVDGDCDDQVALACHDSSDDGAYN